MMRLLLILLQLESILWLASGFNISKPNCVDHCGHVRIPYPFGVGSNCYYKKWFEIICNNSIHPSKPVLRHFNLEVLDINWSGRYSRRDPQSDEVGSGEQQLKVALHPENYCEKANYDILTQVFDSINFRGSPFRFSKGDNVFMVEGCGNGTLQDKSGKTLAGCVTVCDHSGAITNSTSCHGVGCCQAPLLSSTTVDEYYFEEGEVIESYQITLNSKGLANTSVCNMSAALIEKESVKNLSHKLLDLKPFPVVLIWSVNSILYQKSEWMYEYEKLSCNNDNTGAKYCSCIFLYEGNPYLPYGCQVVEECRKCRHQCLFNYDHRYYYCAKKSLLKRPSILGFSIGAGVVLLVLGCYWLYRFVKRRKEIKQKAKYFKKNGGLLLQQQISSNEGVVEKTKVFSVDELEKATDGFNENRILGQGGQGTVYKGMLVDGKIVAIKRSKKVDESQLDQFINEVVILSQINHRNVVKLLGCCLETEVPLLVYEFIHNGTLYQHIRGGEEDFHFSWKMRLQNATESASALAYLHSSSSAPIYHRDIKSSNILLDEKYRAKISDFGTSRAITIEQTHVTTCVQGTYGYLDPEYFQSNQFTEKSDVYSFGVVLVELLTGKKPLCPTKDGGWISLAVEFLSHMESSRLCEILDARIVDEGKEEEFMAVACLARKCLDVKGKQRPTMKDIYILLDGIRSHHTPDFEELVSGESKQVITETVSAESNTFSVGMLPSDADPFGSVEVQPLLFTI